MYIGMKRIKILPAHKYEETDSTVLNNTGIIGQTCRSPDLGPNQTDNDIVRCPTSPFTSTPPLYLQSVLLDAFSLSPKPLTPCIDHVGSQIRPVQAHLTRSLGMFWPPATRMRGLL